VRLETVILGFNEGGLKAKEWDRVADQVELRGTDFLNIQSG